VEPLEDRTVPSFAPVAHYPVGSTPLQPTLADWNGDGYRDVVAGVWGGLRLLPGRGDGTLGGAVGLDPGLSFTTTGDFNGDGRPDLLRARDFSAGVALGNGDGTFQNWADSPHGGVCPGPVVTGDLNGDGRLDAVVADSGDGYGCAGRWLRVLLGNGDGTFQPERTYAAGIQPQTVLGDFNGDGVLDLVAQVWRIDILFPGTPTGRYLGVWLGNGDGTLREASLLPVAYPIGSLAAGDFNTDGRLDLVLSDVGYPTFQGNVRLYLGNGDGTLQAPLRYDLATGPLSLAVADFNRDGRLDLVLGNWEFSYFGTTAVSVLLGNGDGSFQEPLYYDADRGRQWVAVGDFNGDGYADVVAVHSSSANVSVLLNAADWPGTPHAGGGCSEAEVVRPAGALQTSVASPLSGGDLCRVGSEALVGETSQSTTAVGHAGAGATPSGAFLATAIQQGRRGWKGWADPRERPVLDGGRLPGLEDDYSLVRERV
jgi:hypothetical protein